MEDEAKKLTLEPMWMKEAAWKQRYRCLKEGCLSRQFERLNIQEDVEWMEVET